MANYRVSPQALSDLEDIYYYIAVENESPLNAKRFIGRLYTQFHFLAQNPKVGRLKDKIRPGFMVWSEGKYYIFYRITADGVDIVRVINSHRDLTKLFSQ